MTCEMFHFILILIVLLQNDVLGGMGGTLPSPAITEESFVLDYDTEDPHYPMTEDTKVC